MDYIEAPSEARSLHKNRLFLAGGITNVMDWQSYVVKNISNLDITVFNPRRENFDISLKEESEIQIKWEYNRLREATHTLFWFSYETIQPITLFELGAALERNGHRLFIGCDPRYERAQDIKIQSLLVNHHMEISDTLEDLINRINKRFSLPY